MQNIDISSINNSFHSSILLSTHVKKKSPLHSPSLSPPPELKPLVYTKTIDQMSEALDSFTCSSNLQEDPPVTYDTPDSVILSLIPQLDHRDGIILFGSLIKSTKPSLSSSIQRKLKPKGNHVISTITFFSLLCFVLYVYSSKNFMFICVLFRYTYYIEKTRIFPTNTKI